MNKKNTFSVTVGIMLDYVWKLNLCIFFMLKQQQKKTLNIIRIWKCAFAKYFGFKKVAMKMW